MKIFGWSGGEGACEHYRLTLPLTELAKHGHTISINEAMPQGAQYDVVIAQRTSEPAPTGLFLRMAAETKSLMVYELDDDFFHLEKDNPAFGVYSDPERQRRIQQCISAAHLVTVSTEPLAQVCRQFTDNVTVLPNYVPSSVTAKPMPTASNTVTIGWSGGTSHQRDFGECAKPLRAFLQRRSASVDFHCIGFDMTGRVATLRGRTRHTRWNPNVDAYYGNLDFDIGLAPLRDTTFNHSKSPLRCLELAALGVPVIASNTTPYREFVKHERTGLLVNSPAEWRDALEYLTNNPDVRQRMGDTARESVAHLTIETNAHRWLQAYQDRSVNARSWSLPGQPGRETAQVA